MSAASAQAARNRDRACVVAGLAGITAITWLYLIHLAREMGSPMEMGMPPMRAWGAVDVFLMFVMWVVMMAAMMVPSAAPMVLTFSGIARRHNERTHPFPATGAFLAGYLAAWTGFSAAAIVVQWGLHRAALLSPMMVSNNQVLGGTLLIAAGAFQFTPIKHACLSHCRSPIGFFLTEWREGTLGAFHMGFRHGAYCVGCCWLLMALLFVAGVMNLLWVAAIAGYVLVEKVVPGGHLIGRTLGACVIAGGIWMVAGTLL